MTQEVHNCMAVASVVYSSFSCCSQCAVFVSHAIVLEDFSLTHSCFVAARGNWRDAKPGFDEDPGSRSYPRAGFNRQTSYEQRSHRNFHRHDEGMSGV